MYSLGVLLYELLTSTTPFDKETLKTAGWDEFRRMIREVDPARPSTRISTLHADVLSTVSGRRRIDPRKLSEHLRGELDWIVMRALEKDRNRRYESASALAEDIRRHRDNEPVHACPPSVWYRVRKFVHRNKTGLTTGVLVLVALFLGTGLATWQAIRATRAEKRVTNELGRVQKAEQQATREMGRAQRAEKRAEEELLRAQRAEQRATQEAAISKAVNDFLNEDLLSQASPDKGPNPNITLREVLDRAAEKVVTAFRDQPLVEAAVRETLAKTYLSLGSYEKGAGTFRSRGRIAAKALG